MKAIEKLEALDRREEIFCQAGYMCEVCGKALRMGQPQLAHRIPQTKANIWKYGSKVIHHRLNLAPVCSLKCNGAVDIRNNPGAIAELLERIKHET